MDRSREFYSYGAAAMMAPFWPWIREQQMKLCDLIRRDETLYRVGCVNAQDADIGKIELRCLATNSTDTAEQALYPKIVALSIRCSQRGQERSVAATEIDYYRCGPNENLREIQQLRNRCGHKFDRGLLPWQ